VSFEGENILVGIVCLALVPLLAVRIFRGLHTGRLPLYRTYLNRSESEAKFLGLLVVHVFLLLLVAFIAADLLLGLGYRSG
jgi:hypothetical protein